MHPCPVHTHSRPHSHHWPRVHTCLGLPLAALAALTALGARPVLGARHSSSRPHTHLCPWVMHTRLVAPAPLAAWAQAPGRAPMPWFAPGCARCARPVLGAPHSSLVHRRVYNTKGTHAHPQKQQIHSSSRWPHTQRATGSCTRTPHPWSRGPRRLGAHPCLGLRLAALAALDALGARPVLGAPHWSYPDSSPQL